jgi:aryl-alcohol dehydrogenase-like predicted oxidoreductase
MQRLPLGRTGLTVSAIGLGCVSMSDAYGAANEADSFAAMQAALDQGVDFFDTADLYGKGGNESLIGRFIRQAGRGRVCIGTKFGSLPAGADGLPGVDNSPAHIRAACEASLKRLGVDVIDLYYMHRRDPKMPLTESVGAMGRLVEAGKVRALGLSEVAAATLREAHAVHPIAALQSEYSLWYREPEDGVLDACRELGVTFVPFSPIGRGFLAGAVSTDDFAPGDIRRSLPRFRAGALDTNRALVARLGEFARARGATPAQIALAWLLSKNDERTVIVPIPGTKRAKYVVENAGAAAIRLAAEDVQWLESVFHRTAVVGERYPDIERQRAGT